MSQSPTSQKSQLSHIQCITLPILSGTLPAPITCKIFSNTSNPLNFIWSISIAREDDAKRQAPPQHYSAIVKKPEFLVIVRNQISSQKQLYQIVRDALEGKMHASLWYEMYLVDDSSHLLAHVQHEREKALRGEVETQNLNESDVWDKDVHDDEADPFLTEMNLVNFPTEIDKLWSEKENLILRVIYDGEYTNMEFHLLLKFSGDPAKNASKKKAETLEKTPVVEVTMSGSPATREGDSQDNTPIRSIHHNLPSKADSPKPDITSLSNSLSLLEQRRRERRQQVLQSPLQTRIQNTSSDDKLIADTSATEISMTTATTRAEDAITLDDEIEHLKQSISKESLERELEELAKEDLGTYVDSVDHDAEIVQSHIQEQTAQVNITDSQLDDSAVYIHVDQNPDSLHDTASSESASSVQIPSVDLSKSRLHNHADKSGITSDNAHDENNESYEQQDVIDDLAEDAHLDSSLSTPGSPSSAENVAPTHLITTLSNSFRTQSPSTPSTNRSKRKIPQSARPSPTTSRELQIPTANDTRSVLSARASTSSPKSSTLPETSSTQQPSHSHPIPPDQDAQNANMQYIPIFPSYLHPQHQISSISDEIMVQVNKKVKLLKESLEEQLSELEVRTSRKLHDIDERTGDELVSLEERVHSKTQQEVELQLDQFKSNITQQLQQMVNQTLTDRVSVMNAKLNEGLDRIEHDFTTQLESTLAELKREIAEDLNAAKMAERVHQFEENQKKNLKKVLWSIQQMQMETKEHKESTDALSTEIDATQEELASQVLAMRKLTAAMKTMQKEQSESLKSMQQQITELTKSQSLLQAENESLKNLLKSNIEEAVKTTLKTLLAQKKAESVDKKTTKNFAPTSSRPTTPVSYIEIQKRTPRHQTVIPYSTSPLRERRESSGEDAAFHDAGDTTPGSEGSSKSATASTPYLEQYRSRVDSYKMVLEQSSRRPSSSGSPMRSRRSTDDSG